MLWLVPLWLVTFTTLVGWGLLARYALSRGGLRGTLSVFQTMWMGLAALTAFLIVCSLFVPIARGVLIASWIPALAGFGLHRRTLRARFDRRRVAAAAITLLAWLAIAWNACDLVKWYNTGLYHLQAVKWIASYPAVPGLANLHLRLGYNNTIHLFAALLDAYWEGESAHLMNSFLTAAVIAHWIFEIVTARTPRTRVRQVFCLLTIPFFLARIWTLELPSLSTDLPLAILSFVVVLELLTLATGDRELPLAYTLAIAALAMTVKLGGLAIFGVAIVAVVVETWQRRAWRVRVATVALPVTLVVGWMIRGVIASGWLLFPAFGRLPLAWAVPAEVASYHRREIESWARMFGHGPDEVLGQGVWHWFAPWLNDFRTTPEWLLLCAALVLLGWRAVSGPRRTVRSVGECAAIGACVLATVQWFVTAPSLRYGGYLFWLLPAVLLAPRVSPAMRDPKLRPFAVVGAVALSAWSGSFAFHLIARVPSPFGRLRYPETPKVVQIYAGPANDVFMPAAGDLCWDFDLPCTPAATTVTLRHANSLASGFLPESPK